MPVVAEEEKYSKVVELIDFVILHSGFTKEDNELSVCVRWGGAGDVKSSL